MSDQSHPATNNFELTVTNKADLYTRATFHLQRCSRCERPFAPQKPSHWLLNCWHSNKCATKPRNVAGASERLPGVQTTRATLINDDTDVPLVAKEQL